MSQPARYGQVPPTIRPKGSGGPIGGLDNNIVGSFGQRVIAWWLDMMLLQALLLPIFLLIFFSILRHEMSNPQSFNGGIELQEGFTILSRKFIKMFLGLGLFAWSWFAFWEASKHQATPGKIILGLKVRYEAGTSSLLLWDSYVRILLRTLSLITTIPLIISLFDRDHRTLWDKFTHTRVVQNSSGPSVGNRFILVLFLILLQFVVIPKITFALLQREAEKSAPQNIASSNRRQSSHHTDDIRNCDTDSDCAHYYSEKTGQRSCGNKKFEREIRAELDSRDVIKCGGEICRDGQIIAIECNKNGWSGCHCKVAF
jgi:uncharacterized RDD family membrane protein YckC